MRIFTIVRGPSTPFGTFGFMFDDRGVGVFTTLERPWDNNNHDTSCVVSGTYQSKRVDSPDQRKATPENGDRFMLIGTPGRDDVEIHVGNTIKDTKGCILIGMEYGVLYDGTPGIMQSGDAFRRFMKMLEGVNEFTLRILEAKP